MHAALFRYRLLSIHQFVSYIVHLHNVFFIFLEKILPIQLFERKNISSMCFQYDCMKLLVDYPPYSIPYFDMVLIHLLKIHNLNLERKKQNQSQTRIILFFCFDIPLKFDEHS